MNKMLNVDMTTKEEAIEEAYDDIGQTAEPEYGDYRPILELLYMKAYKAGIRE